MDHDHHLRGPKISGGILTAIATRVVRLVVASLGRYCGCVRFELVVAVTKEPKRPTNRRWSWRYSGDLMMMMVIHGQMVQTMIQMVQAKCRARDPTGRRIPLGKQLEYGVEYDDAYDQMKCTKPNACQGWTIRHCYEVQCKADHSCVGAQLLDNQAVTCVGTQACQEANISGAEDVACGLNYLRSCQGAKIKSNASVLCYGPLACVPSFNEPLATFQMGPYGTVQCNSEENVVSCQDMVVEINHGHRACFADNTYDTRRCAVICEAPGVCNKKSIQFRVVGGGEGIEGNETKEEPTHPNEDP